jgi:hypothetical protein
MAVERWKSERAKRGLNKLDSGFDLDLALSSFLQIKKRLIARRNRYNATPKSRAHFKRRWRELRRKYFKRIGGYGSTRRILKNPSALLYKPKENLIRDKLYPDFCKNWIPMRTRLRNKNSYGVKLDKFSFAKFPEETLSSFNLLVKACAKFPELRVDFVDTDCDDITPYIVLAHLRRALPPIFSGGKMTTDVRAVIDAVGMRNDLRIASMGRRRLGKQFINAFPLVNRLPPGTFGDQDHLLRPQLKELVADRFCDTLGEWLLSHDLELRAEAEASFVRGIGEALDNAERHGDPDRAGSEGDWSIAGFARLELVDEIPILRCSIGMVSVGATISQSLESAAPEVRERIDRYVSNHRPLFENDLTVENLRTVMALQDGITRVPAATAGRRGGVGFMELIDVFAELGDNGREHLDSVFTVISGNTCIRVTGPFRQGIRNHSGLRELWFNEENDDKKAPSTKHVMTLHDGFPGVILSACFTIDPDYLRKKLGM